MRLLSLAGQFGSWASVLDFVVCEGLRPRLGTGTVCTCGDTGCPTPGTHSRYLHHVDRPPRNIGALADQAAAHPHANLAVVTGRQGPSGVVVVQANDIDALTHLEARLGTLPATVASRNPHGKLSLWFSHRAGAVDVPAHALGAGSTVIAGGGFALVPGSVTPAGTYRWADGASPADLDFATLPVRWRGALRGVELSARVFGLKPAVTFASE